MDKVIVITGPTAVGKTKLSVELAKKINGEVINADSTQIYRDLDIATAKVTESEQEGVPHHLLDIKNINEDYSVYDYQKDCRSKIEEIKKRGQIPILVGGTGLYIKAALYDYQFDEESESKELEESTEELYNKLLQIDPETDIHPNNRKRIIRALQKYEVTGCVSKDKTDKMLYDAVIVGLTTERDILYNRINDRVDIMIQNGLLEEAKKIYESGIRTKAVMTPIGYKELFPYFDGENSLEESLNQIKQKSRNYAKRQYTWFRHQMPITWFNVNLEHFNETIEDVITYINKQLDK